mmetsp:Transcript_48231/g.73421  ORF Transcript_48231/g.73421 Transcript_48231/m.73421 type:complete len:81 (+) Transcript_48231:91-333(+)
MYLIMTRHDYSIRYNDKSVLENFHVASAYNLTKEDNLNIFNRFSRDEYFKIRDRIIAMVLATDMSSHFSDLAKLKGRLSN